jgi:hypothetical protein
LHEAHEGIVRGVLIDGLNQQIITASSDKTIKVYGIHCIQYVQLK